MIGGPRIVLYPIGITAVVAGVAQLAAMGSADSPEGMDPPDRLRRVTTPTTAAHFPITESSLLGRLTITVRLLSTCQPDLVPTSGGRQWTN